MPFSEYIVQNTIVLTMVGLGLAWLVFVLYCALYLFIYEGGIKKLFICAAFKKKSVFYIIAPISIFIINILFYKLGYGIKFFAAAVFVYAMVLLAAIDLKTQMLPDIITKPLIALGIVQGYLGIFTDLPSSILGAIAGYMVLWSVNLCFRLVRGMDGMGYGDFKLLSAIGAWTGIKMLPLTILLSSVIGIFIALAIIKHTKSTIGAPTPFGPSLVFTGFVVIMYGNDIISWYLKLLQVT